MRQYAARRVVIMFPVLFLVTVLAAGLIRLAPGDAVVQSAAEANATLTQEELVAIRAELGLDRPFHCQYFDWIGIGGISFLGCDDADWSGIITGNLGQSLTPGRIEVSEILSKSVPISIELGVIAMVISLFVAVPIGVWSAIRQDSLSDYLGRLFSISGLSIPDFIIGSMVILFGAIWLRWTPPLTYSGFFEDPSENIKIMMTPALIIGVRLSSITMRMLRSTMLEVLRQDYVRTAWAKGLKERSVIVRHVLKNAFIPVITVVGSQLGFLFGGVVIIETIFNLPGLGRSLILAINGRDLPMVQSGVLVISVFFVMINLLVDLSYAWFDPRIRYE